MSKILIVDDEEMMLMMAKFVLSKKYEIITAQNGAEAIEIFEREQPDMVLSDLMMPEMDGYELHRILQEKTSKPVPIMFMTADESEESEIKGFEIGAADYIRKPLKPDILLRRVGNIISRLDKIHELEEVVSTDLLTGLLNKSSAQEEIGKMVQKSSGALLMIDLDSFKLVNDIYGHAAGDKILISFGKLLKEVVRAQDLVGRMGGDEFIAFLQNVNDEKILKTKSDFLNAEILKSARTILGSDMEISLGVSIGAVFVPDEGREFATLYKKADNALYTVKRNGKHGLEVFGTKNHAAKSSSAEEITQMRQILSERNEKSGAYFVDFETFRKIYQLLVRMADSHKIGLTLMQFTLEAGDFAEEFKEILINSLRRSDCVTQNGKKFLLLLMCENEIETDAIKERIFSQMKGNLAEQITFEYEQVG